MERGRGESLAGGHVVRPFKAPRWVGNPHVQTLVGAVLGPWPRLKVQRRRVETPDGDFIDVDIIPGAGQAAEVGVVVCHGLEANSRAPLPKRLAAEFTSRGWTVLLMNHRGCSGEPNRNVRAYHLGFTADLLLVAQLAAELGVKRTYLAGYSLGGNMVVKLLGELGDGARDLGIQGAVAFSVPFGPYASSFKMNEGLSKLFYGTMFLMLLKQRALRLYRRTPHAFLEYGIVADEIRRARSVAEFDDAFTCKAFQFDGVKDYYDRADSRPYLSKVRTPLLVLNARDDPIVDEASLPTSADCEMAPVTLHYTERGGHCGFIDAEMGPRYVPSEIGRFFDIVERAPDQNP